MLVIYLVIKVDLFLLLVFNIRVYYCYMFISLEVKQSCMTTSLHWQTKTNQLVN